MIMYNITDSELMRILFLAWDLGHACKEEDYLKAITKRSEDINNFLKEKENKNVS